MFKYFFMVTAIFRNFGKNFYHLMGIVIGIDVGISTTKIVGIDPQGHVLAPIRIKAADPVTSLYGAFGKYLYDNGIQLKDVEKVMLTGVGSAYIDSPIYGLPTGKAEEFIADGLGARFDNDLERMMVVSCGTGTSIIKCDGDDIKHVGGIGIGGGTLAGLSRLLLQTEEIPQVVELATRGDITKINVLISDISAKPIPGLPMDAIASLFGNAQTNAAPEDIALGVIWMVLQSICSATVLTAMGSGIKDFVMIGNLTALPFCERVFAANEKMYGVKFHIPEHSQFSTAIGAALSFLRG